MVGTPALPLPGAAADGWLFHVMSREAVTLAMSRTIMQTLSPETNQAKPVHNMKSLVWFGRQLINSHLLVQVRINSGA